MNLKGHPTNRCVEFFPVGIDFLFSTLLVMDAEIHYFCLLWGWVVKVQDLLIDY